VVEDRSLKLVATDGHRLALATVKLAADLPRQEVIVPRKTVLELSKLLADSEDEVSIQLSSTQAAFSFGSVELVSKLVDGKFPDYARDPGAAQEQAAGRTRAAAPGAAARGDPLEREVPRGALGAGRRQPEDRVLQRRAGGGARG